MRSNKLLIALIFVSIESTIVFSERIGITQHSKLGLKEERGELGSAHPLYDIFC